MSSFQELKLLEKMIDSQSKEPVAQPQVRVVGFSAPSESPLLSPTPSIAIPGRTTSNPKVGSPTYASYLPISPDKKFSTSVSSDSKLSGSFGGVSPLSQGITITRESIKKPSSSLSSSLSSNGGMSELSSSIERGLSTMVISAGASASNKPASAASSPVPSLSTTPVMGSKQQQNKQNQQPKQQQQLEPQKETPPQQPRREKQQQQPKQQQKDPQQQQQPKREKQQQQSKQQQGQAPQKQQQQKKEDDAGKEKAQGQGQQRGGKGHTQHAPTTFQYDDTKKRVAAEKKKIVQQTPSTHQVPLFSHLPQYERGSSWSTKLGFGGSDVHPSILQLGIMYANFQIAGSNARAVAMLTAFKQVIQDFETPPSKTFHRELDIKLKPQIQFLIDCRPMSISMGNGINFLKQQMTKTVNLSEEQAKDYLIEKIDSFIQERIVLADQAIASFGVGKISDDDVILTFARSHVVEMIIKKAHDDGKRFRVVVVDSRPKFEGRALLTSLTKHGVKCTYVMLNGISYIMKEVTKVFLGAYSMLSNGGLVSRVGTAVVATMAHSYNVPVMVCCETYKFTERVHLDSICFNQLGDPDELPNTTDPTSPSTTNLPLVTVQAGGPSSTSNNNNTATPITPLSALKDWRSLENLRLLNLLYDLTPIQWEDIIMVITEVGMIPPTSVPVILREYRKEPII